MSESRCTRGALYLSFTLGLVSWAFLVWRFSWVCDDAFISFRYAKHLALGHGLRYNLGSQAPVEGYSNFLWNVLMAIIELFRLDPTIWSRDSPRPE